MSIIIENKIDCNKLIINEMSLEDIAFMINIWFPNNNFNLIDIKEYFKDYTMREFERTLFTLSKKRKLIIRLVELGDFKILNLNRYICTIGIGLETENTNIVKPFGGEVINMDCHFKCKVATNINLFNSKSKIDKDKLINYIKNELPINKLF